MSCADAPQKHLPEKRGRCHAACNEHLPESALFRARADHAGNGPRQQVVNLKGDIFVRDVPFSDPSLHLAFCAAEVAEKITFAHAASKQSAARSACCHLLQLRTSRKSQSHCHTGAVYQLPCM